MRKTTNSWANQNKIPEDLFNPLKKITIVNLFHFPTDLGNSYYYFIFIFCLRGPCISYKERDIFGGECSNNCLCQLLGFNKNQRQVWKD